MNKNDICDADSFPFINGFEQVPVTKGYLFSLEYGNFCSLFGHKKNEGQEQKDLLNEALRKSRELFFYQKGKQSLFLHKTMLLPVAEERFRSFVGYLQKAFPDLTLSGQLREKVENGHSFFAHWPEEAVLHDFIFMKTGVDVSTGIFCSVWARHVMRTSLADLGWDVPKKITVPDSVLQEMEAAKGKKAVETYNRLVRLLYVGKEDDVKVLFSSLGGMTRKKILELAKSPFKEKISEWNIK